MHKERQEMCKCWCNDVMKVTAGLVPSRLGRGRSIRPAVRQRRVLRFSEDMEETLGHQGRTCSVCSQLALIKAVTER
jgi:hypothetical protein